MRTNVRKSSIQTLHFLDTYTKILFVKYVGFASFVILIWDHIDTFPDEVRFSTVASMTHFHLPWRGISQVEYIWKRKKGICKCGVHYILVRCLTVFKLQSSTFFSLWVDAEISSFQVYAFTIPLFTQNRYFTPLGFIINLYGKQRLNPYSFLSKENIV